AVGGERRVLGERAHRVGAHAPAVVVDDQQGEFDHPCLTLTPRTRASRAGAVLRHQHAVAEAEAELRFDDVFHAALLPVGLPVRLTWVQAARHVADGLPLDAEAELPGHARTGLAAGDQLGAHALPAA